MKEDPIDYRAMLVAFVLVVGRAIGEAILTSWRGRPRRRHTPKRKDLTVRLCTLPADKARECPYNVPGRHKADHHGNVVLPGSDGAKEAPRGQEEGPWP